jgi:hypothetical protein
MHITIVADALIPYADTTNLSEETARLAKAFQQAGHQVSCIVPFDKRIDADAHSLARRLTPIKIPLNGDTVSCVRYDGRTADGVNVYLLDVDTGPDGDSAFVLCSAACEVASSFAVLPDACLTLGNEAVRFPKVCQKSDKKIRRVVQITRLSGSMRVDEATLENAASADRIVFCSHQLKDRKWDKGLSALEGKLKAGHGAIIPKPASTAPGSLDKPSRKTAFQMAHSLPVRDDIPLVAVCRPNLDDIREWLSQDVQVAALDEDNALEELTSRYPDRLAVTEKSTWNDTLSAADAVVIGNDLERLHTALAHGALPIALSSLAADAVDLEPSLETGSAIIGGSEGQAPRAALGRLLGAFKMRSEFQKLAARLPGFSCTWDKAIAHYVQLIQEATSERRQHEQG